MHRLNRNIPSHRFTDHLLPLLIHNLHIRHLDAVLRLNPLIKLNPRQLPAIMLTAVVKALRILNHKITAHTLIHKIHTILLSDAISHHNCPVYY